MDILSTLKSEASKLQKQLNSINSAIGVLGGKNSVGRPRKRRVSASARAKMSRAQKARWAKVRGNYLAGEEALSNVQGNASQSQERKILEI